MEGESGAANGKKRGGGGVGGREKYKNRVFT